MFCNFLFQRRDFSAEEQLLVSSLSCSKQTFYSSLLPGTGDDSSEMSSDHGALRSLYAIYQTASSLDIYRRGCFGSEEDFDGCLHPGTSDHVVSEDGGPDVLRSRSPWLSNMLESVAESVARRWQGTISLSTTASIVDPATLSPNTDHFHKSVRVILYISKYSF